MEPMLPELEDGRFTVHKSNLCLAELFSRYATDIDAAEPLHGYVQAPSCLPSGSSPFVYDPLACYPRVRRPSEWVENMYQRWLGNEKAQSKSTGVLAGTGSQHAEPTTTGPARDGVAKKHCCAKEGDEPISAGSSRAKKRRAHKRGDASQRRHDQKSSSRHRSTRGGQSRGGHLHHLEHASSTSTTSTRATLALGKTAYIAPSPPAPLRSLKAFKISIFRSSLTRALRSSQMTQREPSYGIPIELLSVLMPSRKAQFIKGPDDVILVTKVRPPAHGRWQFIVQSVDAAIAEFESACGPSAANPDNGVQRMDPNRPFKRVGSRFSFGGGQREHWYLHVRNEHHGPFRKLLSHPDVLVCADYMRECFRFHQPKLFKECEALVTDIKSWSPDAEGVFPGLPMFAQTINAGPQAVLIDHTDPKNAKFSQCIIAAFGSFNCRTSGHLVFQDLKLILELRPGDVVFIPSAIMMHGNVSVLEHEVRRSWTLYTAGGLFRFRDAGYRTVWSMSSEEQRKFSQHSQQLLQARMGLHMTLQELQKHHAKKDHV